MSNVVDFARAAGDLSHLATALIAEPPLHAHTVQFYEEEKYLLHRVCEFLSAGLRAGNRLVVIANPRHLAGFLGQLSSIGIEKAIVDDRITLLDARQTLEQFLVGGMPDRDLFRAFLSRTIAEAKRDAPADARIRAYGEMVDLLWQEENPNAAIRLEELWAEACHEHSLSLLCAYLMGNFFNEGDAQRFVEVCRIHSHVIPTEKYERIDDPYARLREISFLQQRAKSLENELLHRKELEAALRKVLRDRSRIEEELRVCVKREQEARERAEASDAFKEMLIGILGHDLRNPLTTVLTTARLMTIRGEVQQEGRKRLDRLIASGVRMERMIDQLLDVTRARLANGIPVERTSDTDLAILVAKIVGEGRAAHPGRVIELHATPCPARVDADRLEQVVSNLLGNAIAHGDSTRPIQVDVAPHGSHASVSVHNFGRPIDADLLPRLFDPFKRVDWQKGRTDGLGLGLYIAERIVAAHGGNIEVHSTAETGTRFRATFLRL